MIHVPAELPEHASLQEYLDLTGQTLADLKPKIREMIEQSGEPLTEIPWGVVLVGDRLPTEREIKRGLELEPIARQAKGL